MEAAEASSPVTRRNPDRPPRPRRWWRPERWEDVPSVRSGEGLTRGEVAADLMRNGMGSWAFVFGALVFLAIWMGYNRNQAGVFDPYPFILLNLVLSCLAAMQGAILLIAAKRQDQIASELARHDYDTDVEAREIVGAIHDLVVEVRVLSSDMHRHLGLDPHAEASPSG
jgi:uncharacterized membrane protein